MINAVILGVLLAVGGTSTEWDWVGLRWSSQNQSRIDYIENSCWCAYTGPELSPDDVAWESLK